MNDFSKDSIKERLENWCSKFRARNWNVRDLVFEPPASEFEILKLEKNLQIEIPPSFKRALLEIGRHVEFRWFVPQNFKFPAPFGSNFCGDLHWSIDWMENYEAERKEWVRVCFPDPGNSYDAVWHNKLPFYEVGNGDYWAFDLHPETYENVVYLSHDDGDGHGCVIAENFLDLLERWIPLACPGGEDWQWLPFVSDEKSRIDPQCRNARTWKSLL